MNGTDRKDACIALVYAIIFFAICVGNWMLVLK